MSLSFSFLQKKFGEKWLFIPSVSVKTSTKHENQSTRTTCLLCAHIFAPAATLTTAQPNPVFRACESRQVRPSSRVRSRWHGYCRAYQAGRRTPPSPLDVDRSRKPEWCDCALFHSRGQRWSRIGGPARCRWRNRVRWRWPQTFVPWDWRESNWRRREQEWDDTLYKSYRHKLFFY